jgi:hypothetical protein
VKRLLRRHFPGSALGVSDPGIADEHRLPFDVKVPNATTRKAIAELEAGKGKKFASIVSFLADGFFRRFRLPYVGSLFHCARVANFVRGKKRTLEHIENFYLDEYGAQRRPNGEYELKVPYDSDEELDDAVKELLSDIASDADNRHCFSESEARMEGTDRHW